MKVKCLADYDVRFCFPPGAAIGASAAAIISGMLRIGVQTCHLRCSRTLACCYHGLILFGGFGGLLAV